MEETKLGRDVFVALAAVGWADGKLAPDEADAIVRTALDEGLDIDEIDEIEKATKKAVDLGDIDTSKMSKADRLFVYAVASWIVQIDGHVAEEEQKALDKLGSLLRIPERPREHAQRIASEIADAAESHEPAFFNLPKLRKTLKVRLAQAQKLREELKAKEQSEAAPAKDKKATDKKGKKK